MNHGPRRLLVLSLVLACAGCGGSVASGPDGGPASDPVGGEIGAEALALAPGVLPEATRGYAYDVEFRVTGGSLGGYRWRFVSGLLPAGLNALFDQGPSARLIGVPSVSGHFVFRVEVSDSSGSVLLRKYDLRVDAVLADSPWQPTAIATAPAPRAHHTAVWTGNEMLVWGGGGAGTTYGDGAAYDPRHDRWYPLSDLAAPAPRALHTAVWTGREMIVWGGLGAGSLSPVSPVLGDGAAYDPLTDSWRRLSDDGAPEARSGHRAVWTGREMLIHGGRGATPFESASTQANALIETAAYDPATDTWRRLADPPQPSWMHSAVWNRGRMVVWGGRDLEMADYNSIEGGVAYDPAVDAWSALPSNFGPLARAQHTAVHAATPDDELVLIWGGWRGSGQVVELLRSGAVYSANGGAWAPLGLGAAPTARLGHTAVWTDREMVVWGGHEQTGAGGVVVATGGIYELDAGHWHAVPTVGAPQARTDHTAVWTGDAMVVWGGRTEPVGGHALATGGVWTPE